MSELSPQLIAGLGYDLDLGDVDALGPEEHAANLMSLPSDREELTEAAWERLLRRAREILAGRLLEPPPEGTAREAFIASLPRLNQALGSGAWVADADPMPDVVVKGKKDTRRNHGQHAPDGSFVEDNATHHALVNAWPRPFLESVLPELHGAGPARDANEAYERLEALFNSRKLCFQQERVNIVALRAYQYGVVHDNAGTWTKRKRYDDTFVVAYVDVDGSKVVREFKGTTDPGGRSNDTADLGGTPSAWMLAPDQQYCVRYTSALSGYKLGRATWGPRTGTVGYAARGRRRGRPDEAQVVDLGRARVEALVGPIAFNGEPADFEPVPAKAPPEGSPRYSTIRVQQGSSGRHFKLLPYKTPIHSGENRLEVGGASLGCQVVHGCWFGAFVATVRRGLEAEARRRGADAHHIHPLPQRGETPGTIEEAEPVYTLIDARQALRELLVAERDETPRGSEGADAGPMPLSLQDPQAERDARAARQRALDRAALACSAAKTQLESAAIIVEAFEERFPDLDAEAEVAFRRQVLGPVWGAISRAAEAYGKISDAISAPQRALEPVQKLRGLWQTTRELDHQIAVCRETGDAGQLLSAASALQRWGEALADGLDLLPLPGPLRRTLQGLVRLSTAVGAAGARLIGACFARTDQLIARLFRTGVEHNAARGLVPPPPPRDLALVVDTLLERLGTGFVRADDQEARVAGLARISETLGEAATTLAGHTRDSGLTSDLDLALGGVRPGHPGLARRHLEAQISGHAGSDFLLLNRALLMARRLRALAEERTKAIQLLCWLEIYIPRNTPRPALVLLLGAGELSLTRRTSTGSRPIEVATTAQLGLAPVRGLPDLRRLTDAG